MKDFTTKTILLVSVLLIVCTGAFAQKSSNYTFSTTDEGRSENMSGSTTIIGPGEDDTSLPSDALAPFHSFSMDFLFMGEFWNRFKVSPNGIIWFGNDTDFFPIGANTIGGIPNSRRIAAFTMNESAPGGELNTHSVEGKVSYKEFGTAPNRYVVIEFKEMGCSKLSTRRNVWNQIKISETNSTIELIHLKAATLEGTPLGDVTAGFSVSNVNDKRYTINVNDNSSSFNADLEYDAPTGNIDNINTRGTNRRVFKFESVAPDANPSGLSSYCLGSTSLGLTWTDNTSNELGFVVYGSSDGGSTFTRFTTATADATSVGVTGLTPSTTYIFKVYAFTEGRISGLTGPPVTFTTSAPGGSVQSIISGDSNDPTIWSDGAVPSATTDVIIGCIGDHDVLITGASLTTKDLTISAGSTLRSTDNRSLDAKGDIINNGTMNFATLNSRIIARKDITSSGEINISGDNSQLFIFSNFTNTGLFNSGTKSITYLRGGGNRIINNFGSSAKTKFTTTSSSSSFAIPDGGHPTFTTSSLNVPSFVGNLSSVSVDISHTYNSDLEVRLIAPDGTNITLSRDHGGSANGYSNVTFTDESTRSLPTGSTVLSGDFIPVDLLSSYTGTMTGTWRIAVSDDFFADVGTLNSWSITFDEDLVIPNLLSFADLQINKTGTSRMSLEGSNAEVTGELDLRSGIFATQDVGNQILIMSNTSSSSGTLSTSYVDGPILKEGNTDFIFPIGHDGFAAPLSIDYGGGSNSDDAFLCRYYHQSPGVTNILDAGAPYNRALFDSPITKVSDCEYWTLDQVINSGTPLTVSLSYDAARSCEFTTPAELRVAHFTDKGTTANRWKDEGNGGSNSIDGFTSIFNSVTIDSYSPFTLASTNILLPVTWLSFNATSSDNGSLINWSTIENNQTLEYTIQRSLDGREYSNVKTVSAIHQSEESASYTYLDVDNLSLITSEVYYRIHQIDVNGESSYSEISVVTLDDHINVFNSFPNPFYDVLMFDVISNTGTNFEVHIYTIDGKEIYNKSFDLEEGENKISLDTRGIPHGSYILQYSGESIIGSKLIEK